MSGEYLEFPKPGPGREFHYISAMPGAGKTEYFVQHAVNYVKQNKSNMPVLYVAPTIQLLVEAQKRVYEQLSEHQKLEVVIIVASKSADTKAAGNVYVEPPANAMNYVLGLSTQAAYKTHRLQQGQKFNFIGRERQHKVYMITHEAFVRIKKVDNPEDFMRLKLSTVFFDEARQCIVKEAGLQGEHLNSVDVERLGKILMLTYAGEANPKRGKDNVERKFAFFNVVGMLKNKKDIAKVFEVQRYADVSPLIRRFIERIVDTCASGRNVMTVKLETKFSKGKWIPMFADVKFSPFTVMRPTDLFSGYGAVVLMSAMFKDSQMWKILNTNTQHKFIDMLGEDEIYYARGSKKTALKKILHRHEKNLAMIQERLVCVPLTAANTDALSLTYLNNSCMLPVALDAELSKRAENASDKERRVDLIRSVLNKATVFGDKQLTDSLYEYAAPPLWVAMRAAYKALKGAGCKEALLFINNKKSSRIWEPAQIPYIDLVRDALKHTEGDAEHLTSAEILQGGRGDPRWLKWLHAVCHGKGKFFLAPRTTSVRGLNIYNHHTGYVHLAALNQEPDMYEFCEKMLPTYDVDIDNIIDNVLQTLYRTNLREAESEKKIYMVTSNMYAIDKLAKKVFKTDAKKFKILAGYTSELTTLSYRGKSGAKTEEGKRRQSEGGKKRRKYSAELGKEIQKARTAVNNAKSANKKVEWQKVLDALLSKASVEKEMQIVRKVLGT